MCISSGGLRLCVAEQFANDGKALAECDATGWTCHGLIPRP
jgi:hypothetical protein